MTVLVWCRPPRPQVDMSGDGRSDGEPQQAQNSGGVMDMDVNEEGMVKVRKATSGREIDT